jgi:sugar O-acyltransferase (sialic acid O-acetyltransferase NeuD family)
VVDFAGIAERFPPDGHAILVHLGHTDMGALRIARVAAARAMGYRLARYVSSRAMLWPDQRVGEHCVIYDGAIVEPFASVGEDVILRNGVHISHHAAVGDHCFLAAGACLGGGAVLGPRCFVGLNATVRDNVRIAEGCLIGAGAVVAADTEPDGVYMGVPARRAVRRASELTRI